MISKLLIFFGIVCLLLYGFFTVQAWVHQQELETQFFQPRAAVPEDQPGERAFKLSEGDLYGRLEIPRLNLSVMVMEGVADKTLRLGAGHIPGTDIAIAAHRDTFFRPLKDIRVNDTIKVKTLEGVTDYRVVSTEIVGPNDTDVLQQTNTLTLVTCYPFYYIGPAPKRFIVQAEKNSPQNVKNAIQ
jgi:sortase A